MISTIKVSYGFEDISEYFHSDFIERVFAVATSHKVDCTIEYRKNSVSVIVSPFHFSGAKQISENEGAEVLQSLVRIFDKLFKSAHLVVCSMQSSLPF